MFGLRPTAFVRAVLAGFLATFVMSMVGYWQGGLGLPRVDASKMLAQNAGRGEVWGDFAHYMNGILIALVYARWFAPRLPGPDVVKGGIFGVLNTLVADGMVTPLIDPRVGTLFSRTPRPNLLRGASLAVHVAYGLALGAFYQPPPKRDRRRPAREGTAER